VRRALAIASICLAAALGACGDDDNDEGSQDTAAGTQAPPSETAPQTTAPETTAPPEGCEQASEPSTRERKGKKPTRDLDERREHRLVVTTNCGRFTITLDPKSAPKAAASLVALANDSYFDGTVFHRIVPGFVIQGGDPTATGSGGPGYSTVDKVPSDASYPKGTVAMAKAGNEPPGTAGSQFFVMTGDGGLPPEYALVGEVTDGQDVVDRIGALGDPATEQPTTLVVIESVRPEES
jgi:cyclophilin family peptidyl-prolyl cis-trans isomerase